MNEIFEKLGKKYPFLTLVRKSDFEYIGIVQNQDTNVISVYDYDKVATARERELFLTLGETWWWESNRKLPINIFLKKDFKHFKYTLTTLSGKDVKIVHGPTVRLADIAKKRIKRRTIQLMRKPT
jgi:hypothetical protein|tara:strand:+ start:21378 stop:21752 length:375 start_codon:yes stop_codon:yes gene_type:complete